MKKKEGQYYTKEFRHYALERLKVAPSITALAKELGVPRERLWGWRKAAEPHPKIKTWNPADTEKLTLLKQLQQTKQLLAEKTLAVDFLKGALQRVEARRQRKGNCGERASTTKSGR